MKNPTDILTPEQNSGAETSRNNPGQDQYIFFRRLSKMPQKPEEMLDILQSASGVDQSDLRFRLVGPGFGVMRPKVPPDAIDTCIADMTDFGIPATVVTRSEMTVLGLPDQAKRVNLTDHFLELQTAGERPILRIDQSTDLLVIVTDLSGKAVKQILTTIAYTSKVQSKPFEEILKKLSMSKAAAVFYDMKENPARGAYIDSTAFTFLGLNDRLSHSVAVNFRTIVDEAIRLSKTHAVDYHFGISALPGTKPDWDGPKSDVERNLGIYANYMMAAKQNGLFDIPDPSISPKGAEALRGETWDDTGGETSDDSTGLEPPPPVKENPFLRLFQGAASETIGMLFGIAAIFFFGVGNLDIFTGHSGFWHAVLGILVTAGGAGIFCYSLLLLYYKRMVENTPTSKIRSHSMGITELTGRTRPYYDLRTSHTLTRCIFFECRYYRYQRTGDTQQWKLVRTTSSGKLPFYIEDDTGRVLINPKGAYYAIKRAKQTIQGRFIPTLGIQLADPNTRVVENMIPIGAKIYVLGSAHLQRHGETHRERLMDRLRSVKQDPARMARYDRNGDGHIDAEEWDAARDDIERGVYAESLTSGSGSYESVVIEKPKFGALPFIVADSEESLLKRFAIRSWLFFACGAVAFACGIGMLL